MQPASSDKGIVTVTLILAALVTLLSAIVVQHATGPKDEGYDRILILSPQEAPTPSPTPTPSFDEHMLRYETKEV